MLQNKLPAIFNFSVTALGIIFFIYAVLYLDSKIVNWQFLGLFVFTLTIGTRLSLLLPRSNFAVSFSDAVIFVAFLFFGGEAAIILASLEIVVSCIYLRTKGVKFTFFGILINFGMTACSTAITYFAWQKSVQYLHISFPTENISHLITSLGLLAVFQFLSSSFFAAIFYSFRTKETLWESWKRDCFSSSMMQIAGASVAGIIYKLLTTADFLATTIAFIVTALAYYNYRHIIAEINESIEQAEQAERDKAEIERNRAEQAEKHAKELEVLLKHEEQISSALRKSKTAFQYAAMHDSLTGLANRVNFAESLRKAIDDYKESPDGKKFILFLDLSRFKNINDSLGHTIGDKVLTLVGKRLKRMVKNKGIVARLGGDEFSVILENSSLTESKKLAEKIRQKLSEPFSLSGNSIFIGVNIGIAPFETEYNLPEEILRDADIAMHYAKETGRGTAFFDKELRANFLDKITLESDLRFAVKRNELAMFYQPLISLKDGEIIGFEALLRWHHQKRGFVSPAQFIPIAEDSGLIIPITAWILQETTRQIAEWQKLAPVYQNLMVSVNISGKHLDKESLIDDVQIALNSSKLSPSSLKLEITESAAMENAEKTIIILQELKKLGVQLSIDDFGTGYSSLSYLHRLPFDTLKIDRSFVNSVGENGENSEILQTIISLAKNLRMRVIAEGIETESQLALLQNLGCNYGQGYLLSKPQPKEIMEEMLYQRNIRLPEYKKDDLPRHLKQTSFSTITDSNRV